MFKRRKELQSLVNASRKSLANAEETISIISKQYIKINGDNAKYKEILDRIYNTVYTEQNPYTAIRDIKNELSKVFEANR